MDTLISLHDLCVLLVYVVGIVFGVYLIMVLRHLAGVLKSLRRTLETNEGALRDTLTAFPNIAANMEGITGNIKKGMDQVAPALPAIAQNVNEITGTVKESTGKVCLAAEEIGQGLRETVATAKANTADAIYYIRLVGEVLRIVIQAFSGKTKDKD